MHANVIILSKHRGRVTVDTDTDPQLPAGSGRLVVLGRYGDSTGIVLDTAGWADLRAHINALLGAGRPPAPVVEEDPADLAEAAGMGRDGHLLPDFRERLAAIAATEAAGREVSLHGLCATPRRRGHGRRHDR